MELVFINPMSNLLIIARTHITGCWLHSLSSPAGSESATKIQQQPNETPPSDSTSAHIQTTNIFLLLHFASKHFLLLYQVQAAASSSGSSFGVPEAFPGQMGYIIPVAALPPPGNPPTLTSTIRTISTDAFYQEPFYFGFLSSCLSSARVARKKCFMCRKGESILLEQDAVKQCKRMYMLVKSRTFTRVGWLANILAIVWVDQ